MIKADEILMIIWALTLLLKTIEIATNLTPGSLT